MWTDLGVGMAELLGQPHSTIIMQVEVNGSALRVKRELEDGWFQHISMPLPAVLTIQSGINKLRYATLMGIKKAKNKEIKRMTLADLARGGNSLAQTIQKVYQPHKSKQAQMFSGDAKSAAHQLVKKLVPEVRVIRSVLAFLENNDGVPHRMTGEVVAAGWQMAGALGTTLEFASIRMEHSSVEGAKTIKAWTIEHDLLKDYTAVTVIPAARWRP